ncbi:MAG: c-type cytochrome [bacterium]
MQKARSQRVRRLKIVSALLVAVTLTYIVYNWIRSLPEMADISHENIPLTAAAGEDIFWGKGRCHVCHKIGERGYALRGPNLGDSKEGPEIAIRAQTRANKLQLENPTEYLVQSIAEPGAFVLPKYQNEMPEVFKAPIALVPAEITAVVLYLQSLGGVPNPDEITLDEKIFAGFRNPGKPSKFIGDGDVETGRELFFDVHGAAACAACHLGINAKGGPEGSTIGPDLTGIAGFRTPEHIYQKVVHPDSNIVSGYEEVLIKTKSGIFFIGMVKAERGDSLVLINKYAEQWSLKRDAISSMTVQSTSMMPGNYTELLTEEEMKDLMAYLLTLDGSDL